MTSPITEPLSYVLMHHTQSCTSCGTMTYHSDLFIKRHLTPRCGYGKPIIHLTPTQEAIYSLPIEIVQNSPKQLPFCVSCALYEKGDPFWIAPGQPTRDPYAIVGLSFDDLASESKAKPSTSTTRTKTINDVFELLKEPTP